MFNVYVVPIHASVFGSAARGDGDPKSDIDLFIVRPKDIDGDDAVWREQLAHLATSVRRWTGNHVGITEIAEMEISRLHADEPPIVAELKQDAVLLFFPTVCALLGSTQ
ncbi:MAG: nucleotidyltransferase domain-containing protein [Chloroflexota bacterium]|nr:nucleotidyltransferase domain-containing protein [Chloroflexota bacterium]